MSSLINRQLVVTLTLGSGTFAGANANTLTLSGLRVEADVDNAGGAMMGTARVKIYGMKQNEMNQLAVFNWKPLEITKNTVKITSDDSVVFYGVVQRARPEYGTIPDVFLYIEAQVAHYDQIAPVQATSYRGPTSVAVIMQGLATTMGLSFENNGVNVMLSNPYLPGTTLEKARSIARAAHIDMYIDGTTLAICPKNSPRKGYAPLISAQSGLVRYPMLDKNGVTFECLYNPAIRAGGQVVIQSELALANGTWLVFSLAHRLSSTKPGGPWLSIVRATEGNNIVTG